MMMLGIVTPEMLEILAKRSAQRDERIKAMQEESPKMSYGEAYMRVTCEMDWEERNAAEQRKLDDIRENGT